MIHLRLSTITILMILGFGSSTPILAKSLSAGLAVGNGPGLSVQYGPMFKRNIHASFGGTSSAFHGSIDHQVFVVPEFGYSRWYKMGFYSGLGLGGIASNKKGRQEVRLLSLANQFFGNICETAWFVMAGMPKRWI